MQVGRSRAIIEILHRVPWASVKLRLALTGLLLIAASVAVTVSFTLRVTESYGEQVALDLSQAQTRKVARLISQRLVSLQLTLRSTGEDFDARRPIGEAGHALLAHQPALITLFDTLFVSRPDGNVVAFRDRQSLRTPQLFIGDRDYFRQTIEQQRPVISQPMMGRASGEPVVILTLPLRGADGNIVAVLGGGLRLATHDLMPELTARDEDDPGQTVIIDSQGRILSHADRQWLMRDAAEEPTLTDAMARWVAQGRPAEPDGQARRHGDFLVSSAGVPDADWVVFRSAPAQQMLAGIAQARQRATVLGTGVALAGGLLLFGVTFVTLRPLRQLERSALGLMNGEPPDVYAWPDGRSEIGRLSTLLRHALEARARADRDGRELLDRLQAVMAHAPLGIGFTRDRKFETVSAHFHRLLGYSPGALIGHAPRVIHVSDEFYEALGLRVGAAFAAQRAFDEEIEFQRRDGSHFWGRLQGQPVRWDDAVAGTIWTLEDVTRTRDARATLAWASSHDALTGLANRAEFERRLNAQCEDRRRREPVSALFIDLDRFKIVNDSAGHAAGDAVLVAVARELESNVRGDDTVARLGGDEFAVLLSRCDAHGAASVAETIRSAVAALRVVWAGESLSVGTSIGVVELDPGMTDSAAVLGAADAACYAAKRSGRNNVRVHGTAGLRRVGEFGA